MNPVSPGRTGVPLVPPQMPSSCPLIGTKKRTGEGGIHLTQQIPELGIWFKQPSRRQGGAQDKSRAGWKWLPG